MFRKLRFAKRLLHDLPKHAKLAYCLLRDERMPARNKAGFAAALAVGLNPLINLPEFLPVIGELDALAITLIALRIFIASAPRDLVAEHRRLLDEERSVFDHDLRSGSGFASQFISTVGSRFTRPVTTIDQAAAEASDAPEPSHERLRSA